MIGIVESGSTKTEWVFVDSKTGKRYHNRTLGFNPFYQSIDDIYKTLKNDLIPNLEFAETVNKIYYYGAGCEQEGNKVKVREAFKKAMPHTNVDVEHDLLSAARALFGDKPGLACIAGTGSNTCYYDGKNVAKNVHSLGLFLGDEGSGGYKGKLLIREYIRKALPQHLHEDFENTYVDRTDEILNNVYGSEMPSRYLASFAPFLHKHVGDPFIHALVYKSFDELFDNCILKYDNYRDLTIGFVGSIAFHFKDALHAVAKSKGLEVDIIDPSPSEALVQYHLQKKEL